MAMRSRSLKPGETIWDQSLTDFGARRQKSDAVAYVLFYRTKEGRQRWFTIGKHGAPWTPETARQEAKCLLGAFAHQGDPAADKRAARNAQTVAEVCELYLADAEAGRLVTRAMRPLSIEYQDQAPWTGTRAGRQRRGQPRGGSVGCNFLLCGETPNALG